MPFARYVLSSVKLKCETGVEFQSLRIDKEDFMSFRTYLLLISEDDFVSLHECRFSSAVEYVRLTLTQLRVVLMLEFLSKLN